MTLPVREALQHLRRYLDEVGFVRIHKYVVTPQHYFRSASEIHQDKRLCRGGLEQILLEPAPHLALAGCLMLDRPAALEAMVGPQREAAERLLAVGLLRSEQGWLRMAEHQLVSVQGLPLFIDARMHFLRPEGHQVYLGADSLLLAHYLDLDRIRREDQGLDLGTGSGILALLVAQRARRVVATDVAEAPLGLAALNRVLCDREGVVELRAEDYGETLARGERYAIVTFNPPFMPFPDGLEGPVFAQGPGVDGLGYLRQVIEGLDGLLSDEGTAYIVADLIGDGAGPYFVRDLERYVVDLGLSADVYIEERIDHRIEHTLLRAAANHVARAHPGSDRHQVFARLRAHYLDTLRAQCNYLAVLVVRRGGARPSLRVFNRFRQLAP